MVGKVRPGTQVLREMLARALRDETASREARQHTLRLRDEREKKEATQCLEGMFGKIPQKDCEEVVNCAFEKVG